jgi:hypothetical protein
VPLVAPSAALEKGYSGNVGKSLWIGQRFLRNERGHYTVSGNCGVDRIMVEIDPSVIADQDGNPERRLMNIRAKIQAAARQKLAAGEAYPVFFAHSGRLKHHAIAVTAEDLLD